LWGSPAILYSAQLGTFVVAIAGIKLELMEYMDLSNRPLNKSAYRWRLV